MQVQLEDIERVACELLDRKTSYVDVLQKLQRTVDFALAYVPFYRTHWLPLLKTFGTEGIGRASLECFPFVDRSHISDLMLDLCSDDLPRRRFFRHRTSGTSGEPVTALMDIHDWHMNLVSVAAQLERLGLPVTEPDFGQWCFLQVTVYPRGRSVEIATPLPNSPKWRRLNVPAESGVSAKSDALETLLLLLATTSTVLNGMPTVLLHIGKLAREHWGEIPPPAMVITSGETLDASARFELEQLFGTRVYSFYSAGEVGGIGYECALASGFHLETHRLLVEVSSNGSKPGEVVATTLENNAMPLIRYRTGDYAALLPGDCSCGDPRPRIGPVIGRTYHEYIDLLRHVF